MTRDAPRVARATRAGQRVDPAARPSRTKAVPAAVPPARTGAAASGRRRAARTPHSTVAASATNPLTTYYLVLGSTLALLAIGLPMVLSSSSITEIARHKSPYSTFLSQFVYAIVGLVVMVVAARVPLRAYRRLAWPALAAAVFLQALVFVPSLRLGTKGNMSWIHLGSVTLQPAEFAKLALVLWLATVLGRKQRLLGSSWHALVPAVPGALVVVGLVLVGRDLGTALVVMLLVVGTLFVSGVPMRLLFGGVAITAALVVRILVIGQSTANRLVRIQSTLDGCTSATADKSGACYQVIHGLQALGTGGLTGVGLGASREKWLYLPEAPNDFIFAVIGEELGLLGTLLVLALIGLLGFACVRLIRRHEDPFAKIATAGVAFWIVGQALVNIGVVIGVVPVIGVPLPLVSAGGSALITTLAAAGLLLAFARTEPGAAEALAARPSVARRSLAVVGAARLRGTGGDAGRTTTATASGRLPRPGRTAAPTSRTSRGAPATSTGGTRRRGAPTGARRPSNDS